jgi:hypothetical protein
LVAVVPKCFVCLLAYAGLGAAFGLKLRTVEICGDSDRPMTWVVVGLALALAATVSLVWPRRLGRRRRAVV